MWYRGWGARLRRREDLRLHSSVCDLGFMLTTQDFPLSLTLTEQWGPRTQVSFQPVQGGAVVEHQVSATQQCSLSSAASCAWRRLPRGVAQCGQDRVSCSEAGP